MHALRTIFSYGLNNRIRDEFKTDNTHIDVARKFRSLSRKHSRVNCDKNHKVIPLLLPQKFLNGLHHMLSTNIKHVPNFVSVSLSSAKKS